MELNTPIWPDGNIFEAGKKLIPRFSGHPKVSANFPQLRGSYILANNGKHVLNFDGEFESNVDLPFVALGKAHCQFSDSPVYARGVGGGAAIGVHTAALSH